MEKNNSTKMQGTSSNVRIERDTMGEIAVPADKYWGAQTQRSFENFKIGRQTMPQEIIEAFAVLKKAAALSGKQLGTLDETRADLIARVCDEILDGTLDDQFPLVIYQTGSGTQSNMNVNEVIANRGNELAGEVLLHPNDHVNRSQSSNDTFPTAMHIAAVQSLETKLLPSIERLISTFERLERENESIIKTGRTHLQDATPLTFGQEISAWKQMLISDAAAVQNAMGGLRELALGGTAVGTGLNAPAEFGALAAEKISALTGTEFVTAPNKFHALTSKDALVYAHGAMKALACDLVKIANDVRWLACGPRTGLGEITIPANEPGSSIMPGKVNPTQCEALTMACAQVMGNDVTVGFAASQGNFQLNVYMPVLIYDFLESAELLAEGMDSFRIHCADGIRANVAKMKENLERSLMLVTALNPLIGYENAAKVAKLAEREDLTLAEAAKRLELLTEQEFQQAVDPKRMIGPQKKD